jgi:ACS family glucarate transporter-like MFS transporter
MSHAPPSAILESRATRVRYRVLFVLCTLAFLTYLDRICISRVQGDIARDLRFGELTAADEEALWAAGKAADPQARMEAGEARAKARIDLVFAAFLVGYAIFEIPGGWLGDVWGPRAVIFRIVVWWSIFTALTGSVASIAAWFYAAPSAGILLATLVLVRFLFGAGEAGAYPNISRALGRWFPFRERAGAQGCIWMSSRIGGALAPWTIGSLMVFGGWQGAFWVLGIAGILWAVFFVLWFRDRPEDKPGVNAAECALVRSGASQAGSIYDDAAGARVPWRNLILSRNLLAIYGVAFCVSFSWYFPVTLFPRFLDDRFQKDFSQSEIESGLPFLAGAVGCLVGGRLSDSLIRRTGNKRWGRSLPGLVAFALAGLCAIPIPFTSEPWQAVALLCLALALQDLAVPCIWSVTADVGGRYAGTAGGFMNTIGAVGGALSPLVVGALARESGWPAAYLAIAASYFLGSILWIRVDATETIFGKEPRAEPGPIEAPPP